METTKKLHCLITDALHRKYGCKPDELIKERVTAEWEAVKRQNAVCDVAALYELTNWLKVKNTPYFMRYTSGSSLILYLLDITSGNPLPPHSYCPICNTVYWKPLYSDGFDILQDFCEDFTGNPVILNAPDLAVNLHCGADSTPLIYDGHNIPWQSLWGYGDSFLQFNIGLPKDSYTEVYDYLSSHWLLNCYDCAICNGICEGYEEDVKKISISKITCVFLLDIAVNTPGFHDHICTSADYNYIMQNWRTLAADGVEEDFDLPEPNNVADVYSISGMLHSSGVLDETAQFMIDKVMYSPADLIAFRDDIYQYLLDHGFTSEEAWKGMERVRKGRGLPTVTGEMLKARDHWVLNRCEKVIYLCAKAHVVEKILFNMKLLLISPVEWQL